MHRDPDWNDFPLPLVQSLRAKVALELART